MEGTAGLGGLIPREVGLFAWLRNGDMTERASRRSVGSSAFSVKLKPRPSESFGTTRRRKLLTFAGH
jgi:hypothetical protein